MLKIKRMIALAIADKLNVMNAEAGLDASLIETMLEYPPDTKMGDLALPCFKMSKALRRSPVQIAATIAEGFEAEGVSEVSAVNGYLNIKISDKYLAEVVLPEILEKKEQYGAPDMGKGKTVVLDYSSPNVAKPFHIGHLGTTVIGHALKKLH